MAEARSSSTFEINGAQAVTEWTGPDSQPRYLYQNIPEPSRKVTLDVMDHVNKRLIDMEGAMGALSSVDDVGECVSQYVGSFEDLIDEKIEDRVLCIKGDLEGCVGDEMASVEDSVLQRVRQAIEWTINIDED